MKKLLSSLFLASLCLSAQAQDPDQDHISREERANAILSENFVIVANQLERGNFEAITARALDLLMLRATKVLADHDLIDESLALGENWSSLKASHVASMGIGDYEALSEWLTQKYGWLDSKLGSRVMNLTRLSDIQIFNFGIPVVYHPRDSRWDRVEYKEHFVPYASASTYWIADGACTAAFPDAGGLLCAPGAAAVRGVMQKFIAPKLSDAVYRKFQR